MPFTEFVIEFIRAYAELLSVILWPVVVLLLFFFIWFSMRRSFRGMNPKRRAPLTWEGLYQLFSNLERQYLAYQPGHPDEEQRIAAVLQEIRSVKTAIEQRDDKQVVRTIAQISTMAALRDEHLRSWKLENTDSPVLIEQVEAILPGTPPITPSSSN